MKMTKAELSLWLKALFKTLLVIVGMGLMLLLLISYTSVFMTLCGVFLFTVLLCGFRYSTHEKKDKSNG